MPKPVQASSYTFRDIINGGFLYVDKTPTIYELIRYSKGVYFLARPRRFGKSLLISTLDEIFQGNKELFQGLWLYDSAYTWQTHPVIRIDFSRLQVTTAEELKAGLIRYIRQIAQQFDVTIGEGPYYAQFEDLILGLATEKQVAILIDEYDKPMIDNLQNLAEAQRIRDTLKGFYTMIKALDQYIRFVLITGISKFSRVGIFSGMNNLDDLTMDPRFATLLGITEEELRRDFQEHITAFAKREGVSTEQLLQQIREWYNGFCFIEGCESVYNPFSTLQLFKKRRFANYWFETGTPSFLIKLIKEREYDIQPFEHLEVPELSFSTYEIESLLLIPLLFQTGYLTIKGYRQDEFGEIYTLSYPNYEVKRSFLTHLLSAYNQIEVVLSESHLRRRLYALSKGDLPQFFNILEVFFANIDYDLQLDYEKYYQTIFYLIFLLLGVQVTAEAKTNQGRIDAVVELATDIYLFEFKLNRSAEEALTQIKAGEYYQKYRLKHKAITLVGANFDSGKRKITDWRSEVDQSSTANS